MMSTAGRSSRRALARALAIGSLFLAACGDGSTELSTEGLRLTIAADGSVTHLIDPRTGTDHLGPSPATPLLRLGVGDSMLLPTAVAWHRDTRYLGFTFPGGLEAEVSVESHGSHLAFELRSVSDSVDVAVWGPFPTDLADTIGETVGVVRGNGYAIGLQALNIKTLGGYPWNADDHLPQLDAFEQDDPDDLSGGKRGVLYSVEAARPTRDGSSLQAYCRDRSHPRVISNMGRPRFVAPPFDDGGVVGCRIALFGAPAAEALATIGRIEVAERLPHPMLDGEWVKTNPAASAAYLILPFTEATFDSALAVTARAGLGYLYHPGPFATWGHFALDTAAFPHGVAGLRALSDRAAERGIRIGVHTLSNFVTTNDPYVTPVPDPRLAVVGRSALTGDVTASARELPIADTTYFTQQPDNLHAAVVGQEIVRYGRVSSSPPWRLLEVERGAYSTHASGHAAGDSVAKLLDHGYKVFLTDADLSREMATTLAELFNRAGLRQISFDGLEGNSSTGLGNYGEALFTTTWFDHLNDTIKRHYIADASRPGHYFWHIYTRMNWGEPWYAGFRESQTEYRLKNQAYFRRNYMPGMLGWFSLTPGTSIEDVDWMLARSAGFDAGYAFNLSLGVLAANGHAEQILAHLGEWERARFGRAFTAEQKHRMQDPAREFTLEPVGEGSWDLREVQVARLAYQSRDRQPGEPAATTLTLENPGAEQPLVMLVTATGGTVRRIRGTIDGVRSFTLDVTLRPGEVLRVDGDATGRLFDDHWRVVGRIAMSPATFRLAPGPHTIEITADLAGGSDAALKAELRLGGPAERVTALASGRLAKGCGEAPADRSGPTPPGC